MATARANPPFLRVATHPGPDGGLDLATTAADGTLVLHHADGTTLDEVLDTERRWATATRARASEPVIVGELVVAATPLGANAYDRATGELVWNLDER